eukprot:m51a1_g13837 hypothetical protein (538) ;mRNA; r:512203-514537
MVGVIGSTALAARVAAIDRRVAEAREVFEQLASFRGSLSEVVRLNQDAQASIAAAERASKDLRHWTLELHDDDDRRAVEQEAAKQKARVEALRGELRSANARCKANIDEAAHERRDLLDGGTLVDPASMSQKAQQREIAEILQRTRASLEQRVQQSDQTLGVIGDSSKVAKDVLDKQKEVSKHVGRSKRAVTKAENRARMDRCMVGNEIGSLRELYSEMAVAASGGLDASSESCRPLGSAVVEIARMVGIVVLGSPMQSSAVQDDPSAPISFELFLSAIHDIRKASTAPVTRCCSEELDSLRKEYDMLEQRLEQTEADLRVSEEQAERIKQEADAFKAKSKRENEQLSSDLRTASRKLADAEKELSNARRRSDVAQQELRSLREQQYRTPPAQAPSHPARDEGLERQRAERKVSELAVENSRLRGALAEIEEREVLRREIIVASESAAVVESPPASVPRASRSSQTPTPTPTREGSARSPSGCARCEVYRKRLVAMLETERELRAIVDREAARAKAASEREERLYDSIVARLTDMPG